MAVIDLILSGFFGIRPVVGEDGKVDGLRVHPLVDASGLKSFVVENVRCQGHLIGVQYGAKTGLRVYVDQQLKAHRTDLGPLRIRF